MSITVQIDILPYKIGITLIDSPDTLKELRKKEMYWIYKLKTYASYDLNERDVYEAF